MCGTWTNSGEMPSLLLAPFILTCSMVGVSIMLLWASRPDVSHGWDPGSESIPNFSGHLVTKIFRFWAAKLCSDMSYQCPFFLSGFHLGRIAICYRMEGLTTVFLAGAIASRRECAIALRGCPHHRHSKGYGHSNHA